MHFFSKASLLKINKCNIKNFYENIEFLVTNVYLIIIIKYKNIKIYTMKLIKAEKNGEVRYFSNKSKAAEYINMDSYNIPYYIKKGKKYKGWVISECEDVVLTSEVDKNI